LNLERRAKRGSREIFRNKTPAVLSSRSKSVTGSVRWKKSSGANCRTRRL